MERQILSGKDIHGIMLGINAVHGTGKSLELDKMRVMTLLRPPIVDAELIQNAARTLIAQLVITCLGNDTKRMLLALYSLRREETESSPDVSTMTQRMIDFALETSETWARKDAASLEAAYDLCVMAHSGRQGHAKSILRNVVKMVGPSNLVDELLVRSIPSAQEVIASALLESVGAYALWLAISPAFREGYAGFSEWLQAGWLRAQLGVLAELKVTNEVLEVISRTIIDLNTCHTGSQHGLKWFQSTHSKWWSDHGHELELNGNV